MQKIVNGILQNPAARALILLVLIIPVSVSQPRYAVDSYTNTGILAPAAVAATAAGLWTWSWKWFWLMLGACIVLTIFIQALSYLLG
jgi:hypothetical protein